jgi:predicted transcriptional regulator
MGPLEAQVMAILWTVNECSVWQVKHRLRRKAAYNTVMTTLVRLFRKGLLKRREDERRFFYSPRVSLEQWAKKAAAECLSHFLAQPNATRRLLASCLMEALFLHDRTLLPEAEEMIRQMRSMPPRHCLL